RTDSARPRTTDSCRCPAYRSSRTTTSRRRTGKQQKDISLQFCTCTCECLHGTIRFCYLTKRRCPVRCSFCQGRLRVCSLRIGLSTVPFQCLHATSLFCTVTCRLCHATNSLCNVT